MSKQPGTTNITAFSKRTEIPINSTEELQILGLQHNPLEQFRIRIRKHGTYLKYLQNRHDTIKNLKKQWREETNLAPGRQGAYDEPFRKHYWFAQYMTLLDIINSYEYFYKSSCICLAEILANMIPAENIEGDVKASLIWKHVNDLSPSKIIFEHRLYHSLDRVNEVTKMLLGKSYYNTQPNNNQYRCIQTIFQIRHTLSHNSGQMTQTDSIKLKKLGYEVSSNTGVIDPEDDDFGKSIFKLLRDEARKFTHWLKKETIAYLEKNVDANVSIPVSKSDLRKLFSDISAFDKKFKLMD